MFSSCLPIFGSVPVLISSSLVYYQLIILTCLSLIRFPILVVFCFLQSTTSLCAEVGRVPKNCTQVKVLVEIFTQLKVKVIV